MQEFKAGSADVGSRVDVFVAKKYPQFARAALSILFDKKIVLLNEKVAKPGAKLKHGDKISLDESKLFMQPKKIDLPIIYEDKNVIVIDKPAGVLTHSKGSMNTEGTVASFIEPKINSKELLGNRAGIVHRLDRHTSGVIIAAKNEVALKYLQKQFSTRKVKKIYYAIVVGVPDDEEAIIDAPIERNPKKPQTFKVGSNGKPAQTKYKHLKTIVKKNSFGSIIYSYLELQPVTGRTHQLRVHLKHIKHPIVGDKVYGKPSSRLSRISAKGGHSIDEVDTVDTRESSLLGTDEAHMYLHAASLEVTLPGGDRRVFEAPLPKIFEDFMGNNNEE
jgi:23S rRNA pseudouridine1911/1915/1917 synthase